MRKSKICFAAALLAGVLLLAGCTVPAQSSAAIVPEKTNLSAAATENPTAVQEASASPDSAATLPPAQASGAPEAEDPAGASFQNAGNTLSSGTKGSGSATVDTSSFEGFWRDSWSSRATMSIEMGSDIYSITIRWANSAREYVEWRMNGVLERGGDQSRVEAKIVCKDCEKYIVTADDEGNLTETRVYGNGMATIARADGKLYWFDATEDAGENCVFEKESDTAEVSSGIQAGLFGTGSEEVAPEVRAAIEALVGYWYDESSSRAYMDITYDSGIFSIIIHWANSAWEYYEWRMNGVLDLSEAGRGLEAQILSDDCAMYYICFDEDGVSSREQLVYRNGEARFDLVNGILYWYDATENAGEDCMFEKQK